MNKEAVFTELDSFLALLAEHHELYNRAMKTDNWEALRPHTDAVNGRIDSVQRIVEAIDESLGRHGFQRVVSQWVWEFDQVQQTVQRARGILGEKDRIDDMLGPAGPKLSGAELHRWVWHAAAQLWSDGHEREAVQRAALNVELEMRSKYRRADLDGPQILDQAFSTKPASADMPRWRLPGYEPQTDDFKSAHLGAMSFGKGCFLAIRNLSTHRLEVLEALEQLAALSLLARWIDSAEELTA
jgi:hypothetical protein